MGRRVCAALGGCWGDGSELTFEGCEVRVRRHAGVVVGQRNESVVVGAHEPFVDDTAAENASHVAIENCDLSEGAVGGAVCDALDTAVLCEENGDGVVREERNALIVR